MIADYKFYHGSVFLELIDAMHRPVSVAKLFNNGRLSSYELNKNVGIQIKHSTNRLHPWQFSITKTELLHLRKRFRKVFVVLVCHDDGIVSLSLEELLDVIESGGSGQAWLRVDRRPGEWYSISGGLGDLRCKKAHGVHAIAQALDGAR